jgi:hypothetical protein
VAENGRNVALDNAFAVTAMHARAASVAPGCAGGRDSGAGAGIQAHGRRSSGTTRARKTQVAAAAPHHALRLPTVDAMRRVLISGDD